MAARKKSARQLPPVVAGAAATDRRGPSTGLVIDRHGRGVHDVDERIGARQGRDVPHLR
ncbi:hypothetical protein JDV09_25330 [Mycobacterium sp. Y57]|uniref:hypothetical protein n=1 Tax=Mycolicibacterium xanthum TaxID=2796469 RepID=UPI001C84450E|nr:hypothetical protein [Mycolicibacterium xanthum]MBX7435396.1 hypothetical protein [Mycolicibacterium xanthum]